MQLPHFQHGNHLRSLVATGLITLLTACGGTVDPATEGDPIDPPVDAPTDTTTGNPPDCSTPNHLALTDIESVTDWINALPKPLELPCFVASLPRPFNVNITLSEFSAQRSNGPRNPRIFIFYDRLILSVVPQEDFDPDSVELHVNLLELSYRTEGTQSIKAELGFPIQQQLSYADAYKRLITVYNYSACGNCHQNERHIDTFDGVKVYESVMYRPYFHTAIGIEHLATEALNCDPQREAHRCAMLAAVMGEGDVYWQDFDPEVPALQ